MSAQFEPIHVGNCPVCNAFPVQHIAAPGNAVAFKFLRAHNIAEPEATAAAAPQPAQLEWSPTLCEGKRVSYADAEKACAALGEGWRLPTRMELESILDLTRHEPAVDTTRFPDTKSGWYWSSTPCAWSSDSAWIVSFGNGYALNLHRVNSLAFVRAVRGVPAGQ
ncbi:MAG: DUF1566 domain-containing protein [Lysobacter sp.]|nr:DUF1566 domain-containing protein [Lysobacter sp.]